VFAWYPETSPTGVVDQTSLVHGYPQLRDFSVDLRLIDRPGALFLICQEPVGKESSLAVKKIGPNGCERCYFFRYTLSPTFSCRFGIVTFPSVEAMMTVLPVEEGPNSFERSTLIVNTDPSMLISTFFMIAPFHQHKWWFLWSPTNDPMILWDLITRLTYGHAKAEPWASPSSGSI
jgi:hypothetical protein